MTMKRLLPIIAASSLMLTGAYASEPGGDGDWQSWCAAGVAGKAGSLKWKLEEEIYIGDEISQLYHYHTDAGIARSLASWFDLGLNFREIREEKKGGWKNEARPHLNGTFKWSLAAWQFSDRNRLEYRNIEDSVDRWRYRNQLSLMPPVKLWDSRLQPYVADEVFIDLHGDDFNENRAYAGFTVRPAKYLAADLCYFWQTREKTDGWVDANIIRSVLTVTF